MDSLLLNALMYFASITLFYGELMSLRNKEIALLTNHRHMHTLTIKHSLSHTHTHTHIHTHAHHTHTKNSDQHAVTKNQSL